MPEPIGTGPPRDRLFREPGAPWQAVIDDHVEFMPGDVAWLARFVTLNPSDDLYHGVMLASHVGRRGVPTIRWTHWTLQWGDDGLFGRHAVNPAAVDPDLPPFKIPHSGLGFFLARRASWLGLPPEQRGFGCEGYLPLAYMQAGRSVWCQPLAHGPLGRAECGRNVTLFPALLLHVPGSSTTNLTPIRRIGGVHAGNV